MAESSGGSKKLLWVMIILVLLSSAGAAAAIYLVLDQRDSGEVQQQTVELTPPVFTRIEPFTVNLADDRYGSRLLYTGITLRVGNEQSKTIIEEHMPQVRSRLLILLSGKQANELTSTEGKEELAQAIISRLNVPLSENQPPLDLREVLFTEFIVQ
ncbi:MAG: flagellar basal body-associated protein FliL [Halomonas sp.]|uniref:Flagellar protein FliL n=1 Tax=Vreelandella aquamarina TaxID=77097 RepID=A0A6F8SQU6_9GAMM|nr:MULTISPECIES: flagellar basal body-associated protein FliL [Halomonas]KTG27838.1 flagellar basal body-associated protein FliL [Idiomarina sp. H105]MEC7295021.1 flagellar basal body-associated protein FliL [Pseudomonadota bacterium]OAF06325.1 flagellar basal body-associated protein FliL [Idiomarina sp. WRN-38]MCC4291593.1 flagellar basal body-associated protein FliL [Halomonas axialensis]MCD1652401.1 flagellar basal body-associated protein FliL [Halomonas axialensis]